MEKKKYVDLHLHTTCSDGERSPEEVIADTAAAGLSAIALTDHNCFAIRKPMQVNDLEVIPGAEFSAYYEYAPGAKKEVHIVGLFFDGVDPEMDRIFDSIEKDAYVKAILANLETLGIHVTMEELREHFPEVKKLGRCHIAETLVAKGISRDRDDAMDTWIGNFSPHYLNPVDYVHYVDFTECIRQISTHGGLPVLAHPFHYQFSEEQIEAMIRKYREATDAPLAIEVYYQTYGEERVHFLERMARKYELLMSASSDNHFRSRPFVKGDYALLQEMKEAIRKKH